ncbi:type II toxin-antitoxin system death-on-curing family toxin [Cellulomonas algicola]|uniref:type II toxin-antitoxin system death-on-curing family toxin n=1 Tax=Cellulomonas algicola TaxID=2071633 RepID=UPI001C3FD410|nr:Fic family protein [Cellulomonas algicola]
MTELLYPDMEDALYVCERAGLYIRDEGALASALARPGSVVWGSEAYVGIHLKGAALLDAVNRSHPLLDGNKRLSWTLVDAFCDMNGYRLTVDPDEGDAFVRSVGGDEHLALEDIAAWLEAHARPLED